VDPDVLALFAPNPMVDKVDALFGLGTMVQKCQAEVNTSERAMRDFERNYARSAHDSFLTSLDEVYHIFMCFTRAEASYAERVGNGKIPAPLVNSARHAPPTTGLRPTELAAAKRYRQLKVNLALAQSELEKAINARTEVEKLQKKAATNQRELDTLRKTLEAAPPPPRPEPRQELIKQTLDEVKHAALTQVPITTGSHHGGVVPKTFVEALSAVPESSPDVFEDNVVSTQKGMRRIRFGHKDAYVDNMYVVCQTIVERISNGLLPSLFSDGVPTAVPSAAAIQSIAVQHANMVCEDAKRPHTAKSGGCGYDAAMDIGPSWQAVYASCALTHALGLRITMWRATPLLEQEENRSHWISVCALALVGLGMMTRNTVATLIGIPAAVLSANANVKELTNSVHKALFPNNKLAQPNEPQHIINNYDMIRNAEAAGTLFAELPIPFQMRPSVIGRGDPAKCTFSQRVSDLSIGPTAVVLGQPLLDMLGPSGPAHSKLPDRGSSSSGPSLSAPTSTPQLATSIPSSVPSSPESCYLVVNPTHPSPTLTATLGTFWSTLKTSAVQKSSSLGTSIIGWAASLKPREKLSSLSSAASSMVDRALETSGRFLLKGRRNQSVGSSTTQPDSPLQSTSMIATSPLALTRIKSASDRGAALSLSASPASGTTATGSSSISTHQRIKSENGTLIDVESLATSGPSSSIVHAWTPPIESSLWDLPSGSSDVLEPPAVSSNSSASSSTTSIPLAEVVSPLHGVPSSNPVYQILPSQTQLQSLPPSPRDWSE